MSDLFNGQFGIVNVGVQKFSEDLESAGVRVIDMNWRPPYMGDPGLARMLSDIMDDEIGIGEKIRSANRIALNRLIDSQPVLKDIRPAIEVLPKMTSTTILHSGPPNVWERMVGAVQGAVVGGLIYEGLATNPDEAKELANSGEIQFAPCHSLDAVGPMAGILTPQMPVFVIEDQVSGCIGYASMNEGWGRTLRFGAFDPEVIERLKWMQAVLAPTLRKAIHYLQGVDIKALIGRALHMGDECHNRDMAASSLFFKEVAPAIVVTSDEPQAMIQSLEFLSKQEHFFLNIGMAACKAGLLAASDIPFSTMVTAIARNGYEVGIRLSGTGDEWFTAPAHVPRGLFFPGYSEVDASPDMGDSAITETAGIGAFSMAAAPAIVRFVGGTPEDAVTFTEEMYEITLGDNPNYTIPSLDFRGAPTGIDARAVLESGIAPIVNTGIAHKEAGHGLVGAGVVRVPMGVFVKAIEFIHKQWTLKL